MLTNKRDCREVFDIDMQRFESFHCSLKKTNKKRIEIVLQQAFSTSLMIISTLVGPLLGIMIKFYSHEEYTRWLR